MRQYWRDIDPIERWACSLPHEQWWGTFLRDSADTGFWHETYFLQGDIEAIHVDVPEPLWLAQPRAGEPGEWGDVLRAPTRRARRQELAPVVPEAELERRLRSAEPPTKQASTAARP
jgi:hypothetical protein